MVDLAQVLPTGLQTQIMALLERQKMRAISPGQRHLPMLVGFKWPGAHTAKCGIAAKSRRSGELPDLVNSLGKLYVSRYAWSTSSSPMDGNARSAGRSLASNPQEA